VAHNARWIVKCSNNPPLACGASFNLLGSSWPGPSYANSSWLQGSSVITVFDTTNIAGGQYVCAYPLVGTPPFCTPPAGFIVSATTISTGSSIGMSDLPRVTVGSTAGWPQSGLVCIPSTSCNTSGSEYLGYRLVDATHIQITSRGGDNTTINPHMSGDHLAPSAPMVIAPVPSVNRVVINAAASPPSSSGTVQFSNDLFVPPPSSAIPYYCQNVAAPANPCGYAILNANYHTWAAKQEAGSRPDGTLSVFVSVAGGTTFQLTGNTFKVQPGMIVTFADYPGYSSTVQNVDTGLDQVTVQALPAAPIWRRSPVADTRGSARVRGSPGAATAPPRRISSMA
jgi:hypothetical protein